MPPIAIHIELARLHVLKGADFVRQLKMLTQLNIFKPVDGEKDIYSADGSHREDMSSLIDAARKAMAHGYKVYILPNPQGIRTADFIFERRGVYKMYDLKTITGKASVDNRLQESIEQSNRVLLNISAEYNPIALARSIRKYFERNKNAIEVLIFKGNKSIAVLKEDSEVSTFFKNFIAKYIK